ncbi:hypothetical protein MalM25_20530 [Planctomycetes bacterium MalM25]|nr:hypothetical protein MalM25_20530 [Planctomycetes bacterium MalM25]
MSSLRLQPTFRLDLPLAPEAARTRLQEVVRSGEVGGPAEAAGSCVVLRAPAEEQRVWSPYLTAQLGPASDRGGSGSELLARFTPRPEVWTLLMMVYFGCVFAALAGGVYGCVQWLLGATPWALGLVPIGFAAIGVLHAVSLIGQNLSSHQMSALRERLERIVELASE